MKIVKGLNGAIFSYQGDFPKIAPCECGGEARMAFVGQEIGSGDNVCSYHENKPDEFWPHDCIAIAVYFCKKCAKIVTLWNQA